MMQGDYADELTATVKNVDGSLKLIGKYGNHEGQYINCDASISSVGDKIGEEWEENEGVTIGYYEANSYGNTFSVSDLEYVIFRLTVPHAKRVENGIHYIHAEKVNIELVPDKAGKYPKPTWDDVENYVDIPKVRKNADGWYRVKEYKKAAEGYKQLAELEDPTSEVKYGVMLVHGTGVEKNVEQGLKYIRDANEKGYLYARTVLGILYMQGDGVERNRYVQSNS